MKAIYNNAIRLFSYLTTILLLTIKIISRQYLREFNSMIISFSKKIITIKNKYTVIGMSSFNKSSCQFSKLRISKGIKNKNNSMMTLIT